MVSNGFQVVSGASGGFQVVSGDFQMKNCFYGFQAVSGGFQGFYVGFKW